MSDLIILATLLPGPKHGYQLKREAGLLLGQEVLHNNLVYPLLRRFMANKWVTRKSVPGERGQTRQQYAITALGRKELIARLSSFSEQDARNSDAFRLRVGMFQLLEREVREKILHDREEFLKRRLEHLAAIQKNFVRGHYASEVTWQFCAETAAELDWIVRLRRGENRRFVKE